MLGAELRKARETAGLSQEQVAFRAGVHRTYISLLERDRKSPSVDVLYRICGALGIAASELLGRLEKQARDQ